MSDKASANVANDEQTVCGIIMPISVTDGYRPRHWQDVQDILGEAIRDADLLPRLVSSSDDAAIIHQNIVTNLLQDEIIICDVSSKNPNVMLELGLRLAIGKPVVVVKDDKTNYSFDTGVIDHLTYPADLRYDGINQFKKTVSGKLRATLASGRQGTYKRFLETFGPIQIPVLGVEEIPAFDLLLKYIQTMDKKVSDLISSISTPRQTPPKALFAYTSKDRSIEQHNAFAASLRGVFDHYEIRDQPTIVIGGGVVMLEGGNLDDPRVMNQVRSLVNAY